FGTLACAALAAACQHESASGPTDTPTVGETFVALSSGYSHSCGLNASGTAFCWGLDDFGELGVGGSTLGDSPSQSIPVAVVGGRAYTSIVVGDAHTCAVATNGSGFCWGRGTSIGSNSSSPSCTQ